MVFALSTLLVVLEALGGSIGEHYQYEFNSILMLV